MEKYSQLCHLKVALLDLRQFLASENPLKMMSAFCFTLKALWKIFFFKKNHAQNVVEKLFTDSFLKNQNWEYLWINTLKFYIFVFIACQVEGNQNFLTLSYKSMAFTSYKAFLRNKKWSGTSLPVLLLYSINWSIFIVWLTTLLNVS